MLWHMNMKQIIPEKEETIEKQKSVMIQKPAGISPLTLTVLLHDCCSMQ